MSLRQISHYRIIDTLGAGGMGVVYLAEDVRLHRKIAIKVLPSPFTSDPDRVRRFEQEARAASALNHPNIVTIYDIGHSDDERFIAMEFVAGRTLRAALGQPVPVDRVLPWATQIAHALAAAHAAGIVHRDIKPDNIMVRDDGYVKVLDFGLAELEPIKDCAGDLASTIATNPGMLLGTLHYMSPEQASGERVSGASDLFALGTVLYELTTGCHPLNGATLLQVLHAIATQLPTLPSDILPGFSPRFEELLLRLLAKKPDDRPTARETAAALEELARAEPRGDKISPIRIAKPPIDIAPSVVVGRDKERSALLGAFTSAEAGGGLLLCVAGEAGIGKTTLVDGLLAEVAERGLCRIAQGRCSERLAGTGAYLPWLEALDGLLRDAGHRRTRRSAVSTERMEQTMRRIAPTWYAQVATSKGDHTSDPALLASLASLSQERMKRELATLLETLSREEPLVLFFEDLHWADISTIDLLAYLGSRLDSMRLLIVTTYRPAELLLAKNPFLQIKLDLQSRGLCRDLALEFLSADDVDRYLSLAFPLHQFPPQFATLVHSKTEGSPLFMSDLVRYLRDRGVIAQQHGVWVLASGLPALHSDLPESIRGMIQRKIAQLNDDDRRLLVAASVQGNEFDSAILATALDLDQTAVEERLEMLDRVFYFVKHIGDHEFPDGTLTLRYRFVHILYQGTLYAGLQVTRRIALSKAVAAGLRRCYGDQAAKVAAELANLHQASREPMLAADAYLLAAENASRVFANHEAVALARRGLEVLAAAPDSATRISRERDLRLTLGWSLSSTKGYADDEVESTYARGRELCLQLGEHPELYRPLWGLAMCYLVRGQYARTHELAGEILSLANKTKDPAALATAHYMLGTVLVYLGELELARQHLSAGVGLADTDADGRTKLPDGRDSVISCQAQLTRVLWLMGYLDQAATLSAIGVATATKSGQPLGVAFALYFEMLLQQFSGEFDEARDRAERLLAIAREHALPQYQTWAGIVRGWAAARAGDPSGIDDMLESLAAYERIRSELSRPHFLGLLAEALAHHGRHTEALAAVASALVAADRTGERYYEAALYCLKGELVLDSDGAESAAQCFGQALDIARRQSARSLELRAATGLARVRRIQHRTTEGRALLANVYSEFTEGFGTNDARTARAVLDEMNAK